MAGAGGGRAARPRRRGPARPREEMAERRRAGRGMERPELARPARLRQARRAPARCCESPLPDDPWLERDLRGYFPPAVVERFGHLLAEHPLRRELVATINANHVVNALGPTFVSRLRRRAGRRSRPTSCAPIRIAREVTGAERALGGDRAARPRRRAPGAVASCMAGVDALVEADDALVPRERPRRRPRHDDRHRPRGLRAPGGAAARRSATRPARAPRRGGGAARRARRARGAGARARLPAARSPTRPTSSPRRRTSGARSRTSRRPSRCSEDRVQIGWIEEQLDALPVEHAHAALGAARGARRPLARAARAGRARARRGAGRAGRGGRRALRRGAHPDAMRRLDDLARTMAGEGGADLAGLTLAVRQLRALAELKPRSRGSRARTTKPRPIGPARSSPPHSATRSRMPDEPLPAAGEPVADVAVAVDAVGDLDLEQLGRPAQDRPAPGRGRRA